MVTTGRRGEGGREHWTGHVDGGERDGVRRSNERQPKIWRTGYGDAVSDPLAMNEPYAMNEL
jgi:hypothetical protein